ncbi:MAG TPA: tetratricopeptide repeat protein, partial [Acidobacteriaceae bacterium]
MSWRWILPVLMLMGWVGIGAAAGQAAGDEARARVSREPADVREALSLEREGKTAEAAATWRRVVKADPKNGQAYAQLGLLEARLGNYDAAIAAYRTVRRLRPGMPGLELNYGLALFKSERYKEAAEVLEAELKRHPDGPETLRLTTLTGMAYYGERDYRAAAPYLKKAAESDPKSLPLLLALDHCYLWTKQLDAVMEVYQRILAIDPDSAEADMIAGEALDEKSDITGAIAQFQAAVKAN